jgi:hypothetical protein
MRLAVFIFFIAATLTGAQESGFKVSSPEQIKDDFSTVPCEDKKRLEAVTPGQQLEDHPRHLELRQAGPVATLVLHQKNLTGARHLIDGRYNSGLSVRCYFPDPR